MISPTFNELKLVLFKIVLDVACELDVFNHFNAEYFDKLFTCIILELPVKEFIIFNTVVDDTCRFHIFNTKFVGKFVFAAYPYKSGLNVHAS